MNHQIIVGQRDDNNCCIPCCYTGCCPCPPTGDLLMSFESDDCPAMNGKEVTLTYGYGFPIWKDECNARLWGVENGVVDCDPAGTTGDWVLTSFFQCGMVGTDTCCKGSKCGPYGYILDIQFVRCNPQTGATNLDLDYNTLSNDFDWEHISQPTGANCSPFSVQYRVTWGSWDCPACCPSAHNTGSLSITIEEAP